MNDLQKIFLGFHTQGVTEPMTEPYYWALGHTVSAEVRPVMKKWLEKRYVKKKLPRELF